MPKALAAVVMIGSIRPFEIYRKSDQDPALCRLDAPVLPHSLCWINGSLFRPPTRLLLPLLVNMSSSKNDTNNALQGASGDSPRPGSRPGTRAWARANPTADDPAAALPEAEPDHHLQDAGGDVAGAEEDTAVGTAPGDLQTCNRGDDADAEASQARSAQRLADWLADCNDDASWNHATQAFSRRGIRLMRAPTQSALAEGSMAADLERSATGVEFHSYACVSRVDGSACAMRG